MWIIFKKEFKAYFMGFTAYVLASSFVLICSLFLWFFDNDFNVFNTGNASLNSFFFVAPWIFLFLIPALTMRSIAEEEASGTLQWLFTQPLKISQIVLGKYFAVCSVVLFCLLPTLVFVYTIEHFANEMQALDYGVFFSGYAGLFFVCCSFASVGMFASSLTKNQIVAYILAIFINFLLFYGAESLASYNLLGKADYYVREAGFYIHYNQFLKGIIDTRDIAYFVIIIILFLGFAKFNVHNKK